MEKDCLQLLIEEGIQDAEAFLACATNLRKKGLYGRAIEACNRILEFDPHNAKAYNRRGTVESDLGQEEAAIFDYDRAIELDPNYVVAYNNRGTAKSDLGLNLEAILDFDRAIELDPDDAGSYNNRGAAKTILGQNIEAILDYDRAIELDPDSAGTYSNRGNTKIKLGQKAAAVIDFDRVIELDPDNVEAYNNRGLSKSDLGQKDAAILDFNRAIELKPDNVVAYINRGAAKSDLGQKDAAILDFNRAIELDPNNAKAYNNRGVAKFDLGKKDAALLDYDHAIELDPNIAHAYNNRGFAKYSLGKKDAALLDYNHAIELDPNYSKPYFNRGNAKFDLGQNVAAILEYDRAIELDPNHAESYLNRGFAKYTLGQTIEAWQDILRSLSLQDKKLIALALHQYLQLWSNEYPAPYLIYQLLNAHLYARDYVSFQTFVIENIRHCHPALIWSTYQETAKCLTGREATLFLAFIHLGMGDPITAYRLFDTLADDSDDLAIQYFVQKTANDILEPEREAMLYKALTAARVLLAEGGGIARQWFYAGRILEAGNAEEEAIECYRRAGDWWPADIVLVSLGSKENVSGFEHLSQGLPLQHVEPKAEKWLDMLEEAILFYDLEYEITLATYCENDFPRFWEIWDVEALVEPLRELEATKRENWLKNLFTEKYEDVTAERKADAGLFNHHFDVKSAFDLLKRSKTLASDLALAIGTSRLQSEVHAAFIEYFYLKKKLPATEVFYLFFYLVKCRGKESPEALLAGAQETQKSLLENLLKPSLAFLGFFGDAAAAGMAEFLKTLYWQLFEKQPSMLGKPGEPTAYEQFKTGFKTYIYETMEALGGKEEFLKRYPIEGFLV